MSNFCTSPRISHEIPIISTNVHIISNDLWILVAFPIPWRPHRLRLGFRRRRRQRRRRRGTRRRGGWRGGAVAGARAIAAGAGGTSKLPRGATKMGFQL